mgnify:CR=1 FL=1
MSTRKAIIISALLAIVASVVITESGAYSLNLGHSGGSSCATRYGGIDLKSVKEYAFSETDSGYKVYVQYDNGEEQTADMVVNVEDVTVSGSYWVPLFKKVECHYSGRTEGSDGLVEIDFQGEFDDFMIIGFCSPFAAKRIARQEAANEIERMVEHGLDCVETAIRDSRQVSPTHVAMTSPQ